MRDARTDMNQSDKTPTQAVQYESKFVQANGVRLNYLDWGGTGPMLVMLHGIADSPHMFEDLAPMLKDKYHLVAYARRGHGKSEAPPSGPYDLATLTEDLHQLLNALKIEKTSLLGWSMGGNEITKFAGMYPERVEKLVYLESGYDWTDKKFLKSFGEMFVVNGPDTDTFTSFDACRKWIHAAWIGKDKSWTCGLEAYLEDATIVDSQGKVTPVPNMRIFQYLFASLSAPPRDYKKVKAPALAIYASRFFPDDVGKPGITAQLNEWEQTVVKPFRTASMNRVRNELSGARIEQVAGATHMSIGVCNVGAISGMISEFLSK